MTSGLLSLLAGAALSLAFAYVPRLRNWFYGVEGDVSQPGLTPDQRRAVMGGMLVLAAVSVFGLGCAGLTIDPNSLALVDQPVSGICGKAGLLDLVNNLIAVLIANQALYPILPNKAKGQA